MKCPKCLAARDPAKRDKKELSEKIKIGDVKIDRCPKCGGFWFEKDELRLAKDKEAPEAKWIDVEIKDKSLNWFQFDLWKDKIKFSAEGGSASGGKVKKGIKYCPIDEIPLYQINYGDTSIEIDVCGICFGIWLDKGEFKKIVDYVKDKAEYEILRNYIKNLALETKEIFVGPESIKSEVTDLLMLIKLFKYKLAVQHPILVRLISSLPLTK